jgi:bacteriocin-like protein
MKDNHLTIKLTPAQQKQIKDETGKDIAELNIALGTSGLTEKELEKVSGGASGQQAYFRIWIKDALIT